MEYSIVFSAYNESGRITSTLTQVLGFMRAFSGDFEVIVVDDGSADSTASLVEDYAASNKEIVLIKNPHKGKGPGLWTGVMRAKGDIICISDVDLSVPIEELKKFSLWIKEHGYDLVIGSREGIGAQRIGEPFYRHLMGRVFNFWVQLIALRGINDSQCGFKVFRKGAAKDLFGKLKIYGDNAKEISMPYMGAFDVEVLFLARKLGYKIKELGIPWSYAKTSRLRPLANSVGMALDVLKVRINYLKGVYRQ